MTAQNIVLRTLSISEAFEFGQQQLRNLITEHPGKLPTYTEDGRWVFADDPWAPNWSGGFLTGMMWIYAEWYGDPWWCEKAEQYSLALEDRKLDKGTHDIGFVLEPSWGRWFERTGDQHAKEVLIQGGRTMAGRIQPGGYLSTWVSPGSTFIDVMMNVGIIFRAAEYSDDASLRDVALMHARTSHRYLVRGDGSTIHEGWFDTETGEFQRAATHQGWRSDSTWARGQAWAIYGFTTAYEHSREPDMLHAARQVADYFIEQTREDPIPPNDWQEPAPAHRWESSAGAIAAAGLLKLSEADADGGYEHYGGHGLAILQRLRSTEFVAADTPNWQGILKHARYHLQNGLGVDESVMWGDYYFLEAMLRASKYKTMCKDEAVSVVHSSIRS